MRADASVLLSSTYHSGGRERSKASLAAGSCILSRALETKNLFPLRADVRTEEEEWWAGGNTSEVMSSDTS